MIADLVEFARMLWDELEALRDRIIEAIDPEDRWAFAADERATDAAAGVR